MIDGLVRGTSLSRLNQRTTHVEALVVGLQDGGSIPPASMSRQVIHLTTLFFACVTNCRIARLYFDVRFLVVLPSCWRFWWIRFSNHAVHCLMPRSGNADAMNDLCAKTCETCVTHLRLDPWRLCSKRSSRALCARSQF